MPSTRSGRGQSQICDTFPKRKATSTRSKLKQNPSQDAENAVAKCVSPRKRAAEMSSTDAENQYCSPTKKAKSADILATYDLPAMPLKSPFKPCLASPKRVPLSPRKDVSVNSPTPRLNTAVRPLLQSPKQITPSSVKPASPFRVRALDFGSPVKENTPIVGKDCRKGASSSPQITKARGLKFDNENCLSPSKKGRGVKPMSPIHLAKQQGGCYQRVKQALHTALPDRLLCREEEMAQVNQFLDSHLSERTPGSLYISGAPGTGKTAVLSITRQRLQEADCKTVYLNCMSVRNPQAIFNKILSELKGGKETSLTAKAAIQQLEKTLCSKGPMVVLILDEMDQLDCRNQEVLYTMFEWPTLAKSRLALIGIANALDLTDRILPRLQARPKCKPELLNFAPYTKDQLIKVIKDRLQSLEVCGESVIEPSAVQFCAMKVAAVAGDMRKALDVCRRAVETVEIQVKKQQVLSPGPKSPSKRPFVPKKIGVAHILKIVNEVYGSKVTVQAGAHQTIPLQQKLAMCTLLLIVKQGRGKEVTLGKFHEYYSKVCKGQKVQAVDQSEFISMCSHIEARGILALKKSKEARNAKVNLKLDEKELEVALQDKTLISAVLQTGLSAK